ncbi:MAG: peptide chain release factor 3 [Cyanobacteria bacterium]|nr:peptide chain release factor 3 [Cyanobacteriota bacterium]
MIANDPLDLAQLQQEVNRRRNFAIISHPDAGKTTLTEKLLLYGGAIHEAGAVKARRSQRQATSDWMAMEQQRGISITSTVLQFLYRDTQINLLDTPGHQDFSEDTYRTLAAADNAVMLIDAAKGLEPQTRKLFEVCQLRKLPIFTFANKLDRPARDPLDLLDEIEQELKLATYPMNWPIGQGDRFKGVFDRHSRTVHLFQRSLHGSKAATTTTVALDDPALEEQIGTELYVQLLEEVELLDELGSELDLEAIHAGELTPVFFGSAMTNFGVQLFLDSFLQYALKPAPRLSNQGEIEPTYPNFSGFVFKLQANMDPKHRDRVAFVRVCSGRFEKDMTVTHARSGKTVRLSRPQKLFAQDRESVDEAYPGDVIGLNNPGVFAIGDTIYMGKKLEYEGIPSFSPEIFAYLRNPNPSKFKQFYKGVSELQEEGAVQIMHAADEAKRDPILAAVGQLQFEVVQFRLQSEYGVETRLELLPYTAARWVTAGWDALEKAGRLFNTFLVKDHFERPVLLFKNEWNCQQVEMDKPELRLRSVSPLGSV